MARARARATRWAWPPERARGRWWAWSASPTRSSQVPALVRGVRLGDAAGAQSEGDVLERGQVGEQEVVLEDDGDGAAFGADEHVGGGVVERFAVELDAAAVDRQQSGEAAEQRGLAGSVGSEDRRRSRRSWRSGRRRAGTCRACGRSGRRASCGRWPPAAEEPVAQGDEHAEGDGDQHEAQHDRFVGVDLVREVDGERHGLGATGEVAGERDRRTELTQGAGPGEDGAGDQAGADGGEGDAAEHVPA